MLNSLSLQANTEKIIFLILINEDKDELTMAAYRAAFFIGINFDVTP